MLQFCAQRTRFEMLGSIGAKAVRLAGFVLVPKTKSNFYSRSVSTVASPSSLAARLRRFRDKSTYKGREDPNATSIIYPRNRLGIDVALNGCLNIRHRLTPVGDAYRNLYSRHLLMLSKGKTDSYKALQMEVEPASKTSLYFVPPELNKKFTPAANQLKMTDTNFRRMGRIITDHIGNSDHIFVLDAAVGSHRLGDVKIRVISNSANVNLYLKHLLPPIVAPIEAFQNEITVFVAPDLVFEDYNSFGCSSSKIAVANLDRGVVFVSGTNSLEAIKNAIMSTVTSRSIQDLIPQLAVSAHVISQNGKSSLVFDPSGLLPRVSQGTSQSTPPQSAQQQQPKSKKSKGSKASPAAQDQTPQAESSVQSTSSLQLANGVAGIGGAIWNHYGIFRLFQGVVHSDASIPRKRADIVTMESGSNSISIIQSHTTLAPTQPLPTAVVFLINDEQAILPTISKLSPSQAANFFASGYTGNATSTMPFFLPNGAVAQPGQYQQLLQELVGTSNAHVYVVNPTRKDGSQLSTSEIETIVAEATSGRLAKAASSLNEHLNVNVVTSVNGVADMDGSKGWKKQDLQKSQVALASMIGL